MNSVTAGPLGVNVMDNMLSITVTMLEGVTTISGFMDEIWKLFVDAGPSITNSSVVFAPVMVMGGFSLWATSRSLGGMVNVNVDGKLGATPFSVPPGLSLAVIVNVIALPCVSELSATVTVT